MYILAPEKPRLYNALCKGGGGGSAPGIDARGWPQAVFDRFWFDGKINEISTIQFSLFLNGRSRHSIAKLLLGHLEMVACLKSVNLFFPLFSQKKGQNQKCWWKAGKKPCRWVSWKSDDLIELNKSGHNSNTAATGR